MSAFNFGYGGVTRASSPRLPGSGALSTRATAALLALAATALLLALAGSARADSYSTATPLNTGKLTNAVAVNQASGDVYAASPCGPTQFGCLIEPGGLKRFISGGGEEECSGYPQRPYSVAVNPVNANNYLTEPISSSAPILHSFATACGADTGTTFPALGTNVPTNPFPEIGTDSSGNVYYPNPNTGTVRKFSESGTEDVTDFPIEGLTKPTSASVDSAGNVYVAEHYQATANEKQEVAFSGSPNAPSGGTFTLSFAGETTSPISYSTNETTLRNNVKNALLALPVVGANNAATRVPGVIVEFLNALGGADVSQIACDGSSLTGEGTPTCEVNPVAEAERTTGHVVKYDSEGNLVETFASGEISTASVDRSTGHVFVGFGLGGTAFPGKGSRVAEYNSSGEKIAGFGGGLFTSGVAPQLIVAHMAIDEGAGTVYAADGAASKVQVFEPQTTATSLLKVEKEGSGAGTVTSDIAGIDCGSECEHSYEANEVTLSATPDGSSEFVEWEGSDAEAAGCQFTGDECVVDTSAAKTIKAVFASSVPRALTINETGAGAGAVECEIDGGGLAACPTSVDDGSSVKVVAEANAGSELTELTGAGSAAGNCTIETATEGTCTFTITAGSEVTANFELEAGSHSLTINKAGTGNGSFECKVNAGSFGACAATYTDGDTIVIKAIPDSHSTFVSWAGCSSTAGNECTVAAINANTTVTATFNLASRTLTINKAGTGNGSFECDTGSGYEACQSSYEDGTALVVKAVPDSHSAFASWAGCDSEPGTGKCGIEGISADRTVTATFTIVTHTLTVNKSGSGGGSVSCNGGACASSYADGTTVTLSASADAGSTFPGWSGGGCSGTGNCVVTINSDTTVTATFDANPPEEMSPPATCETDPALCPKDTPKPTVSGPGFAKVQRGRALVKLRCRAEVGQRCRGVLKLTRVVRVGKSKRKKNVLVGKARYNLPAKSSLRVVRVNLTKAGKKLLRRSGKRGLKVKLVGGGVRNRAVKLRQQGGRNNRRRGGGGR
jgi:hypothetical protein